MGFCGWAVVLPQPEPRRHVAEGRAAGSPPRSLGAINLIRNQCTDYGFGFISHFTFAPERMAGKAKKTLGRKTFGRVEKKRSTNAGARRKPAAQPKPKKRASAKRATSGKGGPTAGMAAMWSSLHPKLPATIVTEGESFPIKGLVRETLTTVAGTSYIYIFHNAGDASNAFGVIKNDGVAPTFQSLGVPVVGSKASAAGPTTGRALKLSVHLQNDTALLARGGRCYIHTAANRIRLPQLPSTMSSAQVTALADVLKAHPATRACSGTDFGGPTEYTSYPLDTTDYHDYRTWEGGVSFDIYAESFAVWDVAGANSTERPRPMAPIIFMIEDTGTAVQQWTMSVRPTWATRWAVDTVPGQNMRPLRTASPAEVNAAALAALKAASKPTKTRPDIIYG